MNPRLLIFFICFCSFLHQAIIQGIRPMVPLLAVELDASTFEIGLIAASFSFLPLFLAFKAGKIIDQFKGSLAIILGILTISFSLLIPFLWPMLPMLYLSQTLCGIAHLFIVIAFQNSLGHYVEIDKRDKYFGWHSFWVSGGQLLGPLIGGIISENSIYHTFFIFSMISFLVTILCLLVLRDRSEKTPAQAGQPATKLAHAAEYKAFDLIKIPGMAKAISASMFVQFSKDVLITYFPLFLQSKGASTTQIGALLSAQGVASMAIRSIQGKILTLGHRYTVLFVSLLWSGLCFALIPAFDSFLYWTLVCLVLGAGMGLAQPLSTVAVINLSPAGYSGRTLAIRITGNRIAQSASPLSFGIISHLVGLTPIFFICGALLFAGSFYVKSAAGKEKKA
ncbi:MFS transporter [Halalkalibacter oceani]|uniref:MFS transporter n=1 Tax=Halalkalibacter oceani TaxID=1653776 RepID=UPI0033925729